MKFRHAKLLLLAALGLSLLVSLFANRINPYALFVLYDIGINIILAVSLNLINGYTGQFSLGHAGFMAVGAYTAAVITNQFGALNGFECRGAVLRRAAGRRVARGGGGIAGGIADVAFAGGLSGHRHARLRRNHPRHFPKHECRRRRRAV